MQFLSYHLTWKENSFCRRINFVIYIVEWQTHDIYFVFYIVYMFFDLWGQLFSSYLREILKTLLGKLTYVTLTLNMIIRDVEMLNICVKYMNIENCDIKVRVTFRLFNYHFVCLIICIVSRINNLILKRFLVYF